MRVRIVALVVVAALLAAAIVVLRNGSEPERPELQAALDELVTGKGRAAPGVTAYVRGPRGTWSGAAGIANVATSESMPVDGRMRLESVSKLWVAVVVLRLAEDGKLALDDTVGELLPGVLPTGDRITVRQLLNHTSGLIDNNDFQRDGLRYLRQVGDRALRAELLREAKRLEEDPEYEFPTGLTIRFAAALPLLSEPGTAYRYSNIGYQVAGLVAERVGGAPLAALIEELITGPLGLESAAYDPRSSMSGPHVRGYGVGAGGELTDRTGEVGDLGANGGVVSDAADEGRFLSAVMDGRLLGAAQLAALKMAPPFSDYALGTGIMDSGCAGTAYTHNGGGAAFTTSVLVSGDGRRVAVVLLNGRTTDGSGDERALATATELFCLA